MSGVEENLAGYLSSMVPNDTQPEEKDKTIALSEYASLISRGTAPKYVDYSEIKVIGQRCIRSDGFDPTQAKFHDPAALVGTLSAVPGDVLVNSTGTGTLGRCSIFYESDCWIVDGHVTVVRPNIAKSHPKFISSIINSPCFQRHIDRFCVAGSTNQIELIREPFSNAQIPFRTVEEQSQIAVVLEAIDAAIEKSEALIAKLKEVRAGMLHDLLTCGVDENGEIRDIEDGNHPETWQTDFLGNVVDFYSGGTPSKSRPEYWRGDFPLLTPKDMKRFELNDTSDHVTEEAASHSSKIMPSGTLFIVVRGMILAHTFPVCLNRRPFSFNQDIKAIRGREGLNTRFLAHWFLANAWKFLRKATEATHGTKKLDLDDFQKTLITFPPLAEQSVILDLIEGANEELESEQRELFILRQIKQGLTADLLTGQVRVPPDLVLP